MLLDLNWTLHDDPSHSAKRVNGKCPKIGGIMRRTSRDNFEGQERMEGMRAELPDGARSDRQEM